MLWRIQQRAQFCVGFGVANSMLLQGFKEKNKEI